MNQKTFDPYKYWNQRLLDTFDFTGVGLSYAGNAYNTRLYKLRVLATDRALHKLSLSVKDYHVLDVGCGTGFWLEYWLRKGVHSLSGVDFAEISIQNLRQKYPQVQLYHEDVSNPNLNLGFQYDLISAYDVLYHIVDDERWEKAIQNIALHLKPGGCFF